MAKSKGYRRFIRVNGKLESSPLFKLKSDADDWFEKMKRREQFSRFDLIPTPKKKDIPTVIEKAAHFMNDREKEYGKNTTEGENRNLRVHVLPVFGSLKINQVTPVMIEKFLKELTVTKVVSKGEKKTAKASQSTKLKIKALISAFFEYLLDQDEGFVSVNPVRLIRKSKRGSRVSAGPKIPKNLLDDDQACFDFMAAAKTIGTHKFAGMSDEVKSVLGRPYVYSSILLMIGVRVSEAMGLIWSDVDFKNKTITVSRIYERESKSIIKRTKRGEGVERVIPMPDMLDEILTWWKQTSPYSKPSDFVLSKPGGGNMSWEPVRQMHNKICKAAGVKVSPHALRHTFGRLFIEKTGNLKALQEILGHSTTKTTEIYSQLNAARLQKFTKAMEITTGEKLEMPKFSKSKRSSK